MKTMPGQVVHIPTVAGAVAVVYNGLPRGLRLSGPVLANMYLGQITRWNDPQIAALNPVCACPAVRLQSPAVRTAAAPATSSPATSKPSARSGRAKSAPAKLSPGRLDWVVVVTTVWPLS
jgi:ABC-type phosphate transport system substrate-binding protein